MKKLNHNIKVGDRFEMAPWGWQCEVIPRGEYKIINITKADDDEYTAMVKQVGGNAIFHMEGKNVEYFCGEDVEPEYGVRYSCDEYQPVLNEVCSNDFITEEDDEDFGFWYVGSMGTMTFIESSMMISDFAWIKMPW